MRRAQRTASSCHHALQAFDAIEEAFDRIAGVISLGIKCTRMPMVGASWTHRRPANRLAATCRTFLEGRMFTEGNASRLVITLVDMAEARPGGNRHNECQNQQDNDAIADSHLSSFSQKLPCRPTPIGNDTVGFKGALKNRLLYS